MERPDDNQSLVPPQSISHVSIKIPPFWRKNVNVWIKQVDAQFSVRNITSEVTKFNHVLGNLDSDVAELVSDLLEKPLSNTPYSDLCRRLLHEFEESHGRKLTRLMEELELGSRKPSQLLREMRSLAGSQVKDDFLRTLFIRQLPLSIRSVLAFSTDSLDNLAIMADRIIEFTPSQPQFNAEVKNPAEETTSGPQENRLARLETHVSQLSSAIDRLQVCSGCAGRNNNHQPSKKDISTRCWYHSKFGTKAHKCIQPCNFQVQNKAEN